MPDSTPGLFASLRRFFDTLFAIVQNRFELFTIELQEEKLRLVDLVLWMAAAVVLAILALVVVTFTVVFLCKEESRGAVLIGFSLFYLFAAAGAFLGVRQKLKNRPPPFSETISEIKKDRAWLQSRH